MKVILLKDVGGVGQRDSIKDVADGYALNALIPKGYAIEATPEKIAQLKKRLATAKQQQTAHDADVIRALSAINGRRITIRARANAKGHLFRSISAQDVLSGIQEMTGVTMGTEALPDMHPIRELGEYPLSLKIASASATVTLAIEALT